MSKSRRFPSDHLPFPHSKEKSVRVQSLVEPVIRMQSHPGQNGSCPSYLAQEGASSLAMDSRSMGHDRARSLSRVGTHAPLQVFAPPIENAAPPGIFRSFSQHASQHQRHHRASQSGRLGVMSLPHPPPEPSRIHAENLYLMGSS